MTISTGFLNGSFYFYLLYEPLRMVKKMFIRNIQKKMSEEYNKL